MSEGKMSGGPQAEQSGQWVTEGEGRSDACSVGGEQKEDSLY